jgi:hypothetical protein
MLCESIVNLIIDLTSSTQLNVVICQLTLRLICTYNPNNLTTKVK